MATPLQDADDFEVAQPMHITNSGDPTDERLGVKEKKPVIEKHITRIPQHEESGNSSSNDPKSSSSTAAHKENLKDKLKKHLPGHHSSEEPQEQENRAVNFGREDSGSSEFEVAGFMPMTSHGSSDSTSGASKSKPRLERHISSIPDKDDDVDGEEEKGMSGKLRRTISHIAQND